MTALYLGPEPDPDAHRAPLRFLQQLSPAGAAQIPLLFDYTIFT